MTSNASAAFLAALALVFATAAPARGQGIVDRQVWLQGLAIAQLDEHWRAHLEVQPRVFEDASELGLTIVRGAIGRTLGTPRLTGFVGYAWVPRTFGPGVRHEGRVWQQLSVALPPAGTWTPSLRIRLEQRTLDPWEDVSHRLRLLARAQRTFRPQGVWGLASYNELMLTLDDTARGPTKGFDRNRFYTGLTRRVAPGVTLESGYIWEHVALPGAAHRNDHIAMGVVSIQLSQRR